MKEKKVKTSKHKSRKYNKLARQMKSVMGYSNPEFAKHRDWIDESSPIGTYNNPIL